MENRMYLKEMSSYQAATEAQKKRVGKNPYYDLDRLPSQIMREEVTEFLRIRSREVSISTIYGECNYYNRICSFLQKRAKGVISFRDKPEETWLRQFKGWMLEEKISLTYKSHNVYGNMNMVQSHIISYLRRIVEYTGKTVDKRPEQERDIWELEKLDIATNGNLIKNYKTINFIGIPQDNIREELKKGIYLNLQGEAISCVQREMTAMRRLTKYLAEKKKEVLSSRDIPPTRQAVFKTYSDEELRRLNASIVKMDEQYARVMIIHQMLGTRISDTLTLEMDCLNEAGQEIIIKIRQMKTKSYQKPISKELAELIRKAMAYTRERYGQTKYIFVNEGDPGRPLQYHTIQDKVVSMIHKENLRDDNGRLFGFGTHMYRHYYGVKLTEMHLDDFTIAKLLGHSSVENVKYYRKMSNQILADETREVMQLLSDIILQNLDGWEPEYEQIRQDAFFK